MGLKLQMSFRLFLVPISSFLIGAGTHCMGQTAAPNPSYPAHLPYSFSNFVWWSDDELRALLKKRIPGLGDEVATSTPAEGKIRDALTALLKEKGIAAEVQSSEPSDFALRGERAPGAPEPSVDFSVLSPKILVNKVFISTVPEDMNASLADTLKRREGHEYSAGQDWLVRSNTQDELQSKGYLEAKIGVSHDVPRREVDHYTVNLRVSVDPGPQYRIGAISADGGPLLSGRDLSPYFAQKIGDTAGAGPFGPLAIQLRSLYLHYGYADLLIQAPPN